MSSKPNCLKAIDLFAGIGGIRLGFQKVFHNELSFVFSSEIDKFSIKTYFANFNEIPNNDITKINEIEIPKHDILLAGFPCQAFSIAGLRKGFDDIRGTLFFDIVRIAQYHNPQILFLENVKGLLNHNKGNTFKIIISTLEQLGYKVYYKVLNTKDYGLPQNRERVYIVCFKNHNIQFEFPLPFPLTIKIKDILETNVNDKYYYDKHIIKDNVINENTCYQFRRTYIRENKNNICPTLTANMGSGGHNVPLILDNKGIRKLTPRECARLQGFPDSFNIVVSDTQAYKQFGNSVSIPVIEAIAKNILLALNNN